MEIKIKEAMDSKFYIEWKGRYNREYIKDGVGDLLVCIQDILDVEKKQGPRVDPLKKSE